MTGDDDLLRLMGKHARAASPAAQDDDPIWEKLARGELTPAEDAALRNRAAGDPQIATRYEAYRPLQPALKARIAARAAEAMAPQPRVLLFRRVATVAAPLAAAAVLVLVLARPWGTHRAAPLPTYAFELSGGDAVTRSGTPGATTPRTPELRRSSHVEIVLRPATAVSVPVVVRAFLVRGEEVHAIDLPVERASDGAVRVQGDAGTLFGDVAPGTWDLALTVAPEGTSPPAAADVLRVLRGSAAPQDWQLVDRRIDLLGAP